MQYGNQPHDSSSSKKDKCVKCVLTNEQYQEASVELISMRLINNMFHEEIKILRSQQEDIKALREQTFSPRKKKKAIVVQCTSVMSAQVTCDFFRESKLTDRSENLEKIRCGLIELTEVRRSVSWQYVE